MTNNHFYNGFPAIWNIVVLYFFIFSTSEIANLLILSLLIILKFSPLKCVHPLRVKKFHNISIFFTIIWFLMSALIILTIQLEIKSSYKLFFMFLWVASNIYFILISLFETFKK